MQKIPHLAHINRCRAPSGAAKMSARRGRSAIIPDSILLWKHTMEFIYLITPVLTWLVVGPIKFLINSARQRRWAFDLVGNGGFPEQPQRGGDQHGDPDRAARGHGASGLRRGGDAGLHRDDRRQQPAPARRPPCRGHQPACAAARRRKILRERMGHTLVEIAGGIVHRHRHRVRHPFPVFARCNVHVQGTSFRISSAPKCISVAKNRTSCHRKLQYERSSIDGA